MKELKELLAFAIELGEASLRAISDGKFDWTDTLEFRRAAFMAGDALTGLSKIPEELANLDEAQEAELRAFIKEEFDIPDDDIETKVEGALNIALGVAVYVSSFLKKDDKEGD